MSRMCLVCSLLLIPFCALAKGPTGIGQLRLGLTPDQVIALPHTESVYVAASLSPYKYTKYDKRVEGVDMFSTFVVAPWSSAPLSATLIFTHNVLTEVSIDLNKSQYDEVISQITAKYGKPKVYNYMKKQQCIYRNGASFSIRQGQLYNIPDYP